MTEDNHNFRKKERVSVRLEPELIDRMDALIPQLSSQWLPATRTDVMRVLVLDALERFERTQRGTKSAPRATAEAKSARAKKKTPKKRA